MESRAIRISEARLELYLRIAAGGLTVVGLAICHSFALSEGWTFFVLPMICAMLVLLTRGQGAAIGGGVGVVAGLSLAIALTAHTEAPLVNQLAFTTVAAAIAGLLGYVGGCWRGSTCDSQTNEASSHATLRDARTSIFPHALDPASDDLPDSLGAAAVCGVSADFSAWLDDENMTWPAFDQFVRGALRSRFGAACIRCFHVGPDLSLTPLTGSAVFVSDSAAGETEASVVSPVPARLLKRVLVGHEVYAERPRAVSSSHAMREFDDGGERDPWTWLLPIRNGNRVLGLVAIGHFQSCGPWSRSGAASPGLDIAVALAEVLSVSWRHVDIIHALQRGMQRDSQSGVLNRTELLAQVDRAVEASIRDGEPVMILGMAVEGLRGLDDMGQFARRDELIRRLGDALCAKVRSGDVVGRFADDRFIVVLRRLESRLGRLVARKLIETLRTELGRKGDAGPAGNAAVECISIRGGLAGGDGACADGARVLRRALAALDRARTDDDELVIDVPPAEADADAPNSDSPTSDTAQVVS